MSIIYISAFIKIDISDDLIYQNIDISFSILIYRIISSKNILTFSIHCDIFDIVKFVVLKCKCKCLICKWFIFWFYSLFSTGSLDGHS